MSRLAVVDPGVLTTYQDLGRPDMLAYALAASGAMDQMSVRLINLLLGNDENDAVLETTLMGLTLRALSDGEVAVGGADLGFAVNGRPMPLWAVVPVKEGDVIAFKEQIKGVRAYIAIPGGFDAPVILGSRSVYLRGGLGTFIKKGEELRSLCPEKRTSCTEKKLPGRLVTKIKQQNRFRVVPGPQMDHFSEEGVRIFFSSVYNVSPISDRQGIRTTGEPVERTKGPDIITDPTTLGSIQIPGNGCPIILHRDAQVTGGYTKIAIVSKADMDRAAQLGPGDEVRFELVTRQEALALWKKRQQLLAAARSFLRN